MVLEAGNKNSHNYFDSPQGYYEPRQGTSIADKVFTGVVDGIVTSMRVLDDVKKAYRIRDEYIRFGVYHGAVTTQDGFAEVVREVEKYHPDLKDMRKSLVHPDLIYQPSQRVAQLASFTNNAITFGVLLAGTTISAAAVMVDEAVSRVGINSHRQLP